MTTPSQIVLSAFAAVGINSHRRVSAPLLPARHRRQRNPTKIDRATSMDDIKMCILVPKITLYTTWDTWDVHVYTPWNVQNHIVHDMDVQNHIVQNVHDMGCTQSHCTTNNNLSTCKHAPILEQIDGTRFTENISQALMNMTFISLYKA
ncbi:hypothetical protein YC2023_062400 [Brassica napus]